MSIRNLDKLFRPASVAVIGASDRPQGVGATVMRNLLAGGFGGRIFPVNRKYDAVAGVHAYRYLGDLPSTPDLAVICTRPESVPELIADLGRIGTRAAIVLTADMAAARDAAGNSLQGAMLAAAKPRVLRILGPNCLGLIVPGIGLNASFAHTGAAPGRIAFVSQSGALMAGVLDWAGARGIGFSCFVSLGDGADVDFGDVLDYLGSDADTRAILLYIESIRDARKFMSAARAAARNTPTGVVKAGRGAEGARAAASHTGALAGADDVFDAAIRRAGMLRVETTSELFAAVETLARAKPLAGDRLAMLTNGGGPGVLATDALTRRGGSLATLSEATLRRLDAFLPPTWSRGDPVDIIGDAPVERYVKCLEVLLEDDSADALLFMHSPTAIVPSADIARACAPLAAAARRNVLSCWLGGAGVAEARAVFAEAAVPAYGTPEEAVQGFLQMVDYRRNQELLREVPPSAPTEFAADLGLARTIVDAALADKRDMLSEPEAKTVLSAYGIPVVETFVATNVDEAVAMAGQLGYPVALKVISPDISHKSEVGGVMLNLESTIEVRNAAVAIADRLAKLRPGARLAGYSVQRMMRRPGETRTRAGAHELIVGAATDPIFGPVILFGQGGTAVEVIADRAVALPPLNTALARDLVSRTRVAKLLAGYRDRPAADLDAVYMALVRVAQLVADIPEVVELDINPLLADDKGIVAVDARMRLAPASAAGTARFAIRPYPKELEEDLPWRGKSVRLRPIRPEDAREHDRFFAQLAPEDTQMRFFYLMRELPRSELARMTQIDYDREMAFIATQREPDGEEATLGEVRVIADPDNRLAEFAILVRSDLKGLGLGSLLLDKLLRYCRERGTDELIGQVRTDNSRMIALARKYRFAVESVPEDLAVTVVSLDLKRGKRPPALVFGET